MNIFNTLKVKPKQKVLFSGLLYIFFIITFTYINVLNKKQSLYQQLDSELEKAAKITELLLPPELHHKDMKKEELSKEQIYDNILALSKFTDQRDLLYIYTVILRDNKVLFSSSSATLEERQSGEGLSFYFDHYDDVDPRVFDIFETKDKTYLEYTDHWGTFRSVFIPSYAPDGTFYLSVADLSISHIQALLNEQIYHSILIAILFLLFAYPLYRSATEKLKDDTKRLSEEIKRQTLAIENSQNKLVQNQRVLLQLSKESFFDQKDALIKIISATAKQLEVARVSVWLFNKDRTAIINQAIYNQGEIATDHMAIEAKDHPQYFSTISNTGFVSAHDARTHPATSEFLEDYLLPNNISSMLDTPIYAQGHVIGVTCCQQIGPQRHWSREDEEFARSISDLCSQVLLNERRKKAEELLSLQAHYDELTKLPNRVLFADRFSQAVAHSKRTKTMLAICFLDLDNFKPVNDTYGHDIGDLLLIEVARRLKDTIREQDTVSRQGGDEFTLLLSSIDSIKHCEQLLSRINTALKQPYLVNDKPYNISASIGATLYPNDDEDLDTLVRHADHAMYQAKLSGKNQHHFFDAVDDKETVYRQTQLQEINKALINNEFRLYYQPKVNMRTGKAFGAEALIRWLHPEKGMIPPLDFLPLIEGSELEIKLGNWVINEALQQLAEWLRQGINLEVSINISSYHLQSPAFFERLKEALDTHSAVDSNNLQLEILESSALGDLSAISKIIRDCQTILGVNVALDDFGTGYSSLTHMRDLSANVIKIDQAFVRDLLVDPNDYSIIEGVIGLARAFNHGVIAEGVEIDEQGLMLLLMGCEQAQGYGISRPLPAENMRDWLVDYTPNPYWLNYAEYALSSQQQKIILLQLTTKHWYKNTISLLKTEQTEDMLTECHLGTWFNRLKQDKAFTQDWLNQLKQAHDVMFNLAKELLLLKNSKSKIAQQAVLNQFKASYQHIEVLLQSENAIDDIRQIRPVILKQEQ